MSIFKHKHRKAREVYIWHIHDYAQDQDLYWAFLNDSWIIIIISSLKVKSNLYVWEVSCCYYVIIV